MSSKTNEANSHGEVRLLFLGGGPFYASSIPVQEKFRAFSEYYNGEIITPVIGSTDVTRIGDFRLNTFAYCQGSSVVRNIYSFISIILRGLSCSILRGRFDFIISPNPLMTGLAGLVLARLTGAKLVVEINGNFESSFAYGREGQSEASSFDRLKERLSRVFIPMTLYSADMIKLVYHKQLSPLNIDEGRIRSVAFPNFVPIRQFIGQCKGDGHYILLMGFPWFLKGVDILIRAFNIISPDFPEYHLKVVGWCPEGRDYFQRLAGDNGRIELLDAVEYEEVVKLMTNCSLYVLASRTDSSPRVLREAMASEKPIIAADIDGVSDLIRHGYNGLLFECENVDELAGRMKTLLADRALAKRLAGNGYTYVQEHLSEQVYMDKYRKLISSVTKPG